MEVQISGAWQSICFGSDSWGANELHVACRQLGYSKALFAISVNVSDDRIVNKLQRVNCNGNEAFIRDCVITNGIEDLCFDDTESAVYLVCHTDGTELCVYV